MRKLYIYPSPFSNDQWGLKGNQHHRKLAEMTIADGIEVEGINESALYSFKLPKATSLQVHWPEGVVGLYLRKRWIRAFNRIFGVSAVALIFKCWAELFFRICKKRNIYVFWYIHEIKAHSQDEVFVKLDLILRKLLFKHSRAVITSEHSAAAVIIKRFGLRDFLISPIGDLAKQHGEKISKELAAKNLELDRNCRYLLLFGNKRWNRGTDDFINSFIKANFTNTKLIIAGQGYEKIDSEKLIYLNRLLENEVVRDCFCISDFVINEADEYLNSGVLRTSLGFGKPVICRPYGGGIDMTKDCIIPIDNFKSYESLLAFTLNMVESKYIKMAENAKLRSRERSWDVAYKELGNLYKS